MSVKGPCYSCKEDGERIQTLYKNWLEKTHHEEQNYDLEPHYRASLPCLEEKPRTAQRKLDFVSTHMLFTTGYVGDSMHCNVYKKNTKEKV